MERKIGRSPWQNCGLFAATVKNGRVWSPTAKRKSRLCRLRQNITFIVRDDCRALLAETKTSRQYCSNLCWYVAVVHRYVAEEYKLRSCRVIREDRRGITTPLCSDVLLHNAGSGVTNLLSLKYTTGFGSPRRILTSIMSQTFFGAQYRNVRRGWVVDCQRSGVA